jgi:hypothetical protein
MDQISPACFFDGWSLHGCFEQRRKRSLSGFRVKRQQETPFFQGFFANFARQGRFAAAGSGRPSRAELFSAFDAGEKLVSA